MKLHCPHCGVKGSAEDSFSGRKVKCPKCQGIFTVQPDMALALSEDATPLSAAPVESSPSEGAVDTRTLDEPQSAAPDAVEPATLVAAEEEIEIADDPAEAEMVTAAEEEEKIDWEDTASEIDLQLTGDAEEKKDEEETIALEEAADSFDLPEEEDSPPEDQAGDDRVVETVEDGEKTTEEELSETTEATETAEAVETAETVKSAGIEEEDQPEEKPYGVAQQQCWQCGKKESVGESFVAKDGRLYCTGCLPAEAPDETVVPGQSQEDDAAVSANAESRKASDKLSLGGAIKQFWSKIKNTLSS